MGNIGNIIWRSFVWLFLAVAVYTFVRVAVPTVVEPIAQTAFGQLLDQVGSRVAVWVFPWVQRVDAMAAYVGRNLTYDNLGSAVAGALGVGVFNLTYNWWRNRSIRRMCSAMLYSSGVRIFDNIGTLYRSFTQDGKPYLEVAEAPTKDLIARNNLDVRGALHRLKNEMDALQDFAIAYDYAIWRGLRKQTATVRIRALAVREALEVVTVELDRGGEGEKMNFMDTRLCVNVITKDGYLPLLLSDALFPVLFVAIDLAERLEVGFFRSLVLRWWWASGSSMPLSREVRKGVTGLIEWRHKRWARNRKGEREGKRVWETWWIASSGRKPLQGWSPSVHEVLRKAM